MDLTFTHALARFEMLDSETFLLLLGTVYLPLRRGKHPTATRMPQAVADTIPHGMTVSGQGQRPRSVTKESEAPSRGFGPQQLAGFCLGRGPCCLSLL
jgi:hypothetical protein